LTRITCISDSQADASGPLDFAYAGGPNTEAVTAGTLGVAVAQGSGVAAIGGTSSSDLGNVAVNIANEPTGNPLNNVVFASGTGNAAFNLGRTSSLAQTAVVEAIGKGNFASNLGGAGNAVFAGKFANSSTLSTAFNVGGANNTVTAGPGPFNIAGLVNQTGKTVTNNIH
jgi:hypothetical protein